ncbi:MAG TPA: hypothetical protein PKN09_07005 [Novosphingobium sp.]|nr:hypothetical protein [Novosphingobium sp.]
MAVILGVGAFSALDAKTRKPAGPREPTQAEMRAAVLSLTQWRMNSAGMNVHIEYFEKIGCEKAQGAIGYNCDYLVRFGGDGFDLGNAFLPKGAAQQASARFVLRDGKWIVLQTR